MDDVFVLGIHDGHNSSVALLKNGKIEMAIQEERLTRTKNYYGFPEKSIGYVLQKSEISANDVDMIALSSEYQYNPNVHTREGLMKHRNEEFKHYYIYYLKRFYVDTPLFRYSVKKNREERIKTLEKIGFPRKKINFVNHHLSHAAAAYFSSPWRENTLVLTLDGNGDGICAGVWVTNGSEIKIIAETPQYHSLGSIYSKATFMMGMVPWEHEYKIMGLAPYAKGKQTEIAYQKFKKYLDLDPKNPLVFKRKIPEPTIHIYRRFMKDFAAMRFDYIAAGLQKFTEEMIVKWVREAIKKTGIKRLALGGGVFMNVKANKRIMELPEVKELFIMPSCGDETNSLGAAYWVYSMYKKEHGEMPDIPSIGPVYLGGDISRHEIETALKKRKFEFNREDNIEKTVSELLSEGKIVARASGRMEFGARALGNRSILADPSDILNVEEINNMIKRRDFWMPFAPSILDSEEKRYIINKKGIEAPYMILSFDTRTESRKQIIGAIHRADYTARPQIVDKDWNSKYYTIISDFKKRTGIGAVLNTSFNLHGYPIVRGAEDALWVMENSGLRYLALGDYLVTK